jgi:hypothetical protein
MSNLKFVLSFTACLILFSTLTAAQYKNELQLTGSLQLDSRIVGETYQMNSNAITLNLSPSKTKSPVIAGLLSLILPGAGEFYSESYLKAAIFAVLEIGFISTALVYDKKGDDQTDKFERFADENWSVVRYAEWLQDYVGDGCTITINRDPSLPPWEQVNWEELNACESSFSHRLPRHGEQQYYELIGKYPQYSPGWIGFVGSDYHNLPQIFLDYSKMRGQANDYYNVASTFVIMMYVNHFLSALDAVWTASRYNQNLAVNVRIDNIQLVDRVEFYPTLNLRVNF